MTSVFPWEILYESNYNTFLLNLQVCPEKVLLTSCLEGIVLTANIVRDGYGAERARREGRMLEISLLRKGSLIPLFSLWYLCLQLCLVDL